MDCTDAKEWSPCPRQGWKEQFDQATQLQQQLSEEDQEWLDAPLVTDEEEAW
ncbi:hypothetical protein [Candidatus Electronema sp. JC]|uniref:hypothetical protein n=1 Tax=Candidatus Electronema sp. JC TaxID=3401570 RepID=UPI003B43D51F